MARSRRSHEEDGALRIVDPRQHFLGVMKGGESFFYCPKCKRFLLVRDQEEPQFTRRLPPHRQLGRGA